MIKVVLILYIFYISKQSTSNNIHDLGIEIVKNFGKTVLDINDEMERKEKNKDKNILATDGQKEKLDSNSPDVSHNNKESQGPWIEPLEQELLKNLLLSFLRCKPCVEKLYNLPKVSYINILGFNFYDLIKIINKLSERKDFELIFKKIFDKIRYSLNFESWVKLIKMLIENIWDIPAVKIINNNFYINYSNNTIVKISIDDIDNCPRDQRQIIKTQQLLEKVERFSFYIYKFYYYLDNPFYNYAERFAGTALNNLFDGFSPLLSLFFKKDIEEATDGNIYYENLIIDFGNDIIKYSIKKFGSKFCIGAMKKFIGPIGLAIDLFSFSYNFMYPIFKDLDLINR